MAAPVYLRPSVIAVVGFVAAAAAAVLGLSLDRDEPSDLPPPAVVGALPSPPLSSDRRLPAIDVLRTGPGGDAVIAGRALPGAVVRLHDVGRGIDIGQVVADGRGEWVLVPELPLGAGVRLLAAESGGAGDAGVALSDPVVVVVPEAGQGDGVAVETPVRGGARLLRRPPAAGAGDGLDLALVDRDEDGRLTFAGLAAAGDTVHLYLDNRFVGRVRAGDDGSWRLAARGPHQGRHVSRADAVNARGKVMARVEREWDAAADSLPAGVAAAARLEAGAWRITRRAGDGGTVSTVVYRSDAGERRDPDVLYPGQVVSASRP